MKRTPLRRRSKRMAAIYVERRKLVAQLLAEHPTCERCQSRPSQDCHELLSRARGGSVTDPSNIACLCRPCHQWVTEHPLAAEDEGWALSAFRSWQRPA